MGVVSYETQTGCTLEPSIIFKALALDFTNLLPKVLPEYVKSSEFVQGNGGVGSVRQITFGQGESTMYVKERIDSMDEENMSHSYTVIEGKISLGKFEKITNELKIEASGDGGSIIKSKTSYYYNMGDHEINQEEVKAAKEESTGLYKAIEAYLLANPADA